MKYRIYLKNSNSDKKNDKNYKNHDKKEKIERS